MRALHFTFYILDLGFGVGDFGWNLMLGCLLPRLDKSVRT